MMTHPDTARLAASLDGALSPGEHAALRAHVLACPRCARQLDLLRADAARIARASLGSPAPDLRGRLDARRGRPLGWLAGGLALAGALAALLLFAALLGAGRSASAGRGPARLVLTDRRAGQVLALNAASGARLAAAAVGDSPGAIVFDAPRGRLYIALPQAVVALDASTLAQVGRWDAPAPLGAGASLALDPIRARLYLAQPNGVLALALEPALTPAGSFALAGAPQALALLPDGSALFALDPPQAKLWRIDLASGAISAQLLADARPARKGWLAAGSNALAVLLSDAQAGQPVLWQIDPRTRVGEPLALAPAPPPWDLAALASGALAVARGDGAVGGVELLAGAPLASAGRLDAQHDQHHLAAGPGADLFGLNFSHGTVTRYDTAAGAVVWRVGAPDQWMPWDAVYLPGGS